MLASRLRFSRRLPWEHAKNRLTLAVEERSARKLPVIDLTGTNPTRAGPPLSRGGAGRAPPPRRGRRATSRIRGGFSAAREALAAALSRPGDPVSPDDLVLTASTSESYSHLFKLFADPGDEVLTAAPSYPLLDNLAALDSLVLTHVYLRARPALQPRSGGGASWPSPIRTRLLALIHPGNPTGRFLTAKEQEAIVAALRRPRPAADLGRGVRRLRRWARRGPTPVRRRRSAEALAFSLGGLSKSAGLPSWKLGWIRVGGAPELRRRAVAALEMVADTYLSVATPVQSRARRRAGAGAAHPRGDPRAGRAATSPCCGRRWRGCRPSSCFEPRGRVGGGAPHRRSRSTTRTWSSSSSSTPASWSIPATSSTSRRTTSSSSPSSPSRSGSGRG